MAIFIEYPVLALAIGIVLTDFDHLHQLGTDPLAAIGGALAGVIDGYGAMFSGAIGDPARIGTAIQSGRSIVRSSARHFARKTVSDVVLTCTTPRPGRSGSMA